MEIVPGLHWVERIWDTKVYVLFEADRVVLIDAATPGRAGAVWRHLDSLGYPPEAVDEIWLTHGDIDHMGSVAALKAGSGARVVAHRADAPLVDGQAGPGIGTAAAGRLIPASGQLGYPPAHCGTRRLPVDHPVEDGDDLGGWQVVHVPGHTAGSVCFYQSRRGIAIVGDAINHRRGRLGAPPPMFTPDMARPTLPFAGSLTLDFEVCCFGHGPPLVENARQRVQAFAESL